MRIFYSSYELKPKASLSHRAGDGARVGALLRVDFPQLGFGYADCHPWTELGDPPLSEQLRSLASGTPTQLGKNSLEFARSDASARAQGKSLWDGLQIPSSHALVTDIARLGEEELSRILEDGFTRIKIKMGRDLVAEAQALDSLHLDGRAQLRLDFNEGLREAEFATFLSDLSAETLSSIDFIEDPVKWRNGFISSPVPLALDRALNAERPESWPEVLILKPAISDSKEILRRMSSQRLVVTSYLDHPLGQLTAAWTAARARKQMSVEICGLLSHTAYEPNAFSEMLQVRGPVLLPPSGAGFGWGEALEKLAWKELS